VHFAQLGRRQRKFVLDGLRHSTPYKVYEALTIWIGGKLLGGKKLC